MNADLLGAILRGYQLRWDGIHGLHHWARVLENGVALAERTGADKRVVELFALFHDARRENEGTDPGHGARGAELATMLYLDGELDLSDEQAEQLFYACERHTDGITDASPTVGTCWDADRLDLGRVSIAPQTRYLCTAAAKDPAVIAWAEGRSRSDHSPPIADRWLAWADALELPRWPY